MQVRGKEFSVTMPKYSLIRAVICLLFMTPLVMAGNLSWKFTPDGWKPEEWIMVKSPRWSYSGTWIQKTDHIENAVPAGAKPEEWQGKRAPETYTSMVYQKPFVGDMRVTATTWFTPRMAPIIVFAAGLGKDNEGRVEYREHFEVCIYDEGVNVWHHIYTNGKPSWKKAAYAKFPLKPETRYLLDVEVKGKQMIIRIDGHETGCLLESLPTPCYVGITGCEGINHFYDMSITGTPGG